MAETMIVRSQGGARWVKCSAWLRDRRDKTASRVWKDCKPSRGAELEVPCDGNEKTLTFGPAVLLGNTGVAAVDFDQQPPVTRGWAVGQGPCRPLNPGAVPPRSSAFSTLMLDRDLFYRMNRWAGTAVEGEQAELAGDAEGMGWFDPQRDRAAEGEYARDDGPGGDNSGTVKCAPPPPGAKKCILSRVRKQRDDADSHLRPLVHPNPGAVHVDGWDVHYVHLVANWGFSGAYGKIAVCVKAAFKCTPKYRYILLPGIRFGATDEEWEEYRKRIEREVYWDFDSVRSPDGGGARMFGHGCGSVDRGCGCAGCSMVQRVSEVATWTLGVIANDRLTSHDEFWSVALLHTALSDPTRDVAQPD